MTANIEQVAAAHRNAYLLTDARPFEWDQHVDMCGVCGTLAADAARAHRFVNAYLLANPTTTPAEIGDVLAYFEGDIVATQYEPMGRFWTEVADYFERAITSRAAAGR
jgi:hypothetical protein